jgi:hypothetical protein
LQHKCKAPSAPRTATCRSFLRLSGCQITIGPRGLPDDGLTSENGLPTSELFEDFTTAPERVRIIGCRKKKEP